MELKAVFRYGPPADAAAGDGEGAGTPRAGEARGVAAAGALAGDCNPGWNRFHLKWTLCR